MNVAPTRMLYYYGPQRVAVEHHLLGTCVGHGLPCRLVGINGPSHLHGLEDICFVEVQGHPAIVPTPLREMLLQRGCVIWRIDDSALRVKYDSVVREPRPEYLLHRSKCGHA